MKDLILKLQEIQKQFYRAFGVKDIYSNSRPYELIIANNLGHYLLAGFSGSRDAKDKYGYEYEYKHFKESSSNHTWTFNDFSDTTIRNLKTVKDIIFAHVDDRVSIPIADWYYEVSGEDMSNHLATKTLTIRNTRKMINISPKSLQDELKAKRQCFKQNKDGVYMSYIIDIFETSRKLEEIVGTKNIMTSNKIWEVLIGAKLGHAVLTEQKAFDAVDKQGNYYEYKVAKTPSWNFEDISDKVLEKFRKVKQVILAKVNKETFQIETLYEANPTRVAKALKDKLSDKIERYEHKGGLRRLQVSLSEGDLKGIKAKLLK